VFAVLVIAAAALFAFGLLLLGLGRRHRFNDVERFHRARQMTSAWALGGTTQPVVPPRDAAAREEPAER
jgi:hypothetical protein